jgi:aminoglycoside phosphotransferase (APT) family kinase protein
VSNSAEPRAGELPKNLMAWVARTMGPGTRIQVVRRLPMGSWHLNHAVTVVNGDSRVHRLVLRRWRPGWDRDDPDYAAAREMTILELLRPTPVPAPALVGADIDGDECEVPTLLLTRLPGHPATTDAFTTSCNPAPSANNAVINSGAFPNVTFRATSCL